MTAKFSEEFYNRLGHQVAGEIVDWFNQVDSTYRSDLRELNELNFARFDAKLEQRFAEYDAKWERRLAEYDAKWERRFGELRAEVAIQKAELAKQKAELIKWMFAFWAPTAVGVIALLLK